MNYIKQINIFNKMAIMLPISPLERSIYYVLMDVDNSSGWRGNIRVSIRKLMEIIHVKSIGRVHEALSHLEEMNLITICKNKAKTYITIVEFNTERENKKYIIKDNYLKENRCDFKNKNINNDENKPVDKNFNVPQKEDLEEQKRSEKEEISRTAYIINKYKYNNNKPTAKTNAGLSDELIETLNWVFPSPNDAEYEFLGYLVKMYGEDVTKDALIESGRHNANSLIYTQRILERWARKMLSKNSNFDIVESCLKNNISLAEKSIREAMEEDYEQNGIW